MKRVLILGGTGEAAQLAAQAAQLPGVEVITSLAGRTRRPVTPAGRVRIGGFGGDAGLVDYMRAQHIDLLIDATHPFAAHISCNAAHAAYVCGLPRLLLMRPPWEHVQSIGGGSSPRSIARGAPRSPSAGGSGPAASRARAQPLNVLSGNFR